MKRKLTKMLVFVMLFTACFTSAAEATLVRTELMQNPDEKGSTKTDVFEGTVNLTTEKKVGQNDASNKVVWAKNAQGTWMASNDNVQISSSWLMEKGSVVSAVSGVITAQDDYYLLDKNGYLVADQLVMDGEGNYYSFNDQHDGRYGALRTVNGTYNGIKLTFSQKHDGTFGSITNEDGIKQLSDQYGSREMNYINNSKVVVADSVAISETVIYDTPEEDETFHVSYDLDGIIATKPDKFLGYYAAEGTKLKKPATPSDAQGKAVFKGWFMDEDREDAFDFENETYYVDSDIVFYAKWTGKSPAVDPDYLTFTAEQAGSTIKFDCNSDSDCQISTDGGETWNDYTPNEPVILTSVGNRVSFRATNAVGTFSMTGIIAGSGSVTSITDRNGGDPDVDLQEGCYSEMFAGCISLTTAPSLPATTLADECYSYMFQNCTGLMTAPFLPATTLTDSCYKGMFSGCTGLKVLQNPEVTQVTLIFTCPSTTGITTPVDDMFNGTSSLSELFFSGTPVEEKSYYFRIDT